VNTDRLSVERQQCSVSGTYAAPCPECFQLLPDFRQVGENGTRLAARHQFTLRSVGAIGKQFTPNLNATTPGRTYELTTRRSNQTHLRESLFDEGRIATRQTLISFHDMIKSAMELDVCNWNALDLSQRDELSDLRRNERLQSRARDFFFFATEILAIVKSGMCARVHPKLMT